MKPAILCAGRLYCDVIFTGAPRLPSLGTEVFAKGLSLHAGGGAFITAATLAALGHRVSLLSVLPAAPFESIVAADLTKHGIDAGFCEPAPPGSDPQMTVAINAGGDRAFLTRAPGQALPPILPEFFQDFDHLHIGELATLQEAPGLLAAARDSGLTISLDCGWQDEWSSDVADLISGVDVFLPNTSEASALSAIGVPEDTAALTVVKCGTKGARARKRGTKSWTKRTASSVRVVDTTGAGDAFNAGFVSKWLVGADLPTCLEAGNECGAMAVQQVGGATALRQMIRQTA